jgi:hypothetical protein
MSISGPTRIRSVPGPSVPAQKQKGGSTVTDAAVGVGDRPADGDGRGDGDGSAGITPERFELDVRTFLDANAPLRAREHQFVWGQGSDSVSLFPERTPEQEADDVARARTWAQTVFDAGFGWISGPPAYGGRGLPREYQRIYHSVAADYALPSLAVYGIGWAWWRRPSSTTGPRW